MASKLQRITFFSIEMIGGKGGENLCWGDFPKPRALPLQYSPVFRLIFCRYCSENTITTVSLMSSKIYHQNVWYIRKD